MFAFLLDMLAGYIANKYIRALWAGIGLAIFGGVLSALIGNALVFAFSPDVARPGEVVASALVGMVLHPMFALAFFLYFRRRKKQPQHGNDSGSTNPTPQRSANDATALRLFVEYLCAGSSKEGIRQEVYRLMECGHERNAIVEFVREHLGEDDARIVENLTNA